MPAYPYGTQGGPALGTVAPGLPRRKNGYGEISWTIPGTYIWTVPDDFPSDTVCAVAIGGGGGGWTSGSGAFSSGAGASCAWANDISVSPGQQIMVVVGQGGTQSVNGTLSYFMDTSTCASNGAQSGSSGSYPSGTPPLAGNGFPGGNSAGAASVTQGAASGGAAGGYSGPGANGAVSTSSATGVAGTGGSGGSGSVSGNTANPSGGVGLTGEGPSGAAGGGGSGGQDGQIRTGVPPLAGLYGAGGSASYNSSYPGASGGVRIIYGPDRRFPSQNTGTM
jgi:hypothetical protein